MFDTYGTVQLKVGVPQLKQYSLGDKVPLSDGVYVDIDGLVIVDKGIFIAQLDRLYNYEGYEIDKLEVERLEPEQ